MENYTVNDICAPLMDTFDGQGYLWHISTIKVIQTKINSDKQR
jgi:hypothetical protein